MELSRKLIETRSEYEDPVVETILERDRWMILSEIRPSDEEYDLLDDIPVDKSFDWSWNISEYSTHQLHSMTN